MKRCLELARLGAGKVAPNPMVGCVIVCEDKIIGEGFHRKHGEAHAEVNAINSVSSPELLKRSTLFVTLEPCAHFGLTPPCADLIIEKQIPEVIIGTLDPFKATDEKGVDKLKKAGIRVETGVLENECREINRRFFTFHEQGRPYIILKWAQTHDGFIDVERSAEDYGRPTWITGSLALRLVHKIRSEEGAILVGRETVRKDNPSLSVRHWTGNNPLRLVIDNRLQLTGNLNVFDGSQQTIIFNNIKDEDGGNVSYVKIQKPENTISEILDELRRRNILSVIVEGGRRLLESFIELNLWDEALVFTSPKFFGSGVRAPKLHGKQTASECLDNDRLSVFVPS